MTKAELVSVVAEKVGSTKKEADAMVETMFDAITEAIKKGEKVQVDVPVVVVGESFSGTIVNQDATSVSLEVEATHIPQHVEVDVEGLEEGARITAGELALPKGATLITDPEVLVVAVSVPAAAAADEASAEDEAAADAGDASEDAATESE